MKHCHTAVGQVLDQLPTQSDSLGEEWRGEEDAKALVSLSACKLLTESSPA